MQGARPLLYLTYFIYFFCGMTQCFEGAFLPEFKQYFDLTYQQQMYTMFAKNIPFLLAVVIGYFVKQIGYRNCLTTGMCWRTGWENRQARCCSFQVCKQGDTRCCWPAFF